MSDTTTEKSVAAERARMRTAARSAGTSHRIVAALALALVVAGCQTAPGPGSPRPTASATVATGTAATTPTPGPTATPEPAPTATPTRGPVELDDGTVAARHDRNLREAGSFRVDYSARIETSGGAVERRLRIAVDFDADRGTGVSNLTAVDPDGTVNSTLVAEKYLEGRTTHRRLQVGHDDPTVLTSRDAGTELNETSVVPGDGFVAMLGGEVARWVEGHTWTRDGTARRDGVEMARYALASDTYTGVSLAPFDANGTISSARVRDSSLLVSEGVVRRLSLELEATNDHGETTVVTVEFAVTDVGATNVEAPEWIEDA